MLHKAMEKVSEQKHSWQNFSWKRIILFPEMERMVLSEKTVKYFSHMQFLTVPTQVMLFMGHAFHASMHLHRMFPLLRIVFTHLHFPTTSVLPHSV